MQNENQNFLNILIHLLLITVYKKENHFPPPCDCLHIIVTFVV